MNKPRGWHRITIEWSDGPVLSTSSLEAHYGDEEEVYDSVAITLGDVLRSTNLPVVTLLAHTLAYMESDDTVEQILMESAGRYLRRMRERDAGSK